MIYRFLFVGYCKELENIRIIDNADQYVALAYYEDKVFMYVESNKETVIPDALVDGNFIPYPDGTRWERANEIFHYSKPLNEEQWKRKIENKAPYWTVNRLKPEKIASYIFYHYQYQEEMPGDGDRYGVIYLYQDQLIFYHERPGEKETELMEGALSTKHTPKDSWHVLMSDHFADKWRPIENIVNSAYIKF